MSILEMGDLTKSAHFDPSFEDDEHCDLHQLSHCRRQGPYRASGHDAQPLLLLGKCQSRLGSVRTVAKHP